MALSNMQVYNEDIVGTTIELLAQKTDVFNAASGGTIILSTARFRGDFSRESFFNQIAAARRRVDRYASNGNQAATALTQGEHVGVKVAGGFGPVLFEPAQLTWLSEDPAAAIRAISEGFSDALLQDQLNTAVAAAVAACLQRPRDRAAACGVLASLVQSIRAERPAGAGTDAGPARTRGRDPARRRPRQQHLDHLDQRAGSGAQAPGGAGRNRTLGLEKLMAIEVPTPSLNTQKTFDRLQVEVAALKVKHAAIREANAALLPATLERVFAQ